MGLLMTCVGLLAVLLTGTDAAKKVDAHYHAKNVMQRRLENTLQRREQPPLDASELFGMTAGETLENVRETTDALGTKVERLQEKYNGIPVYDTVVTVRKTKDDQFTGDASGQIVQGINHDIPDTTPKLSDRDSLKIAAKAEGDNIHDIKDEDVNYMMFVYIHTDNTARLVNIVSYLLDGVKRPFYIIDLNSGEILKHWQGLNTYPCCNKAKYYAIGGNVKLGKINYGDMPHCLSPKIVNGTCILENDYVKVVDMQQSYNNSIVEAATFECESGYGDEVNGAYSPAVDAFFYGTVVGKMFEEWFDSTPLHDKVVLRVHFGEMYENAYWNGENTTFGDGYYSLYPLTSLDVVGHEIGHGVTEQGSGLEYRYESGGVNEAFSDILGEAAEDYLLDSDFVTGYSIMKHQDYMREFERPERDNMSIGHADDMTEHEDPHFSSGVFRRVWWVVVKQGNLPIRDAATVFLHANRMYWHSTATFYECSCGVLKAAVDLGIDTYPFHVAFEDVGLKKCDITSHIFSLNNNETQSGIKVSSSIKPVFKFPTPPWADQFFATAVSASGAEVRLTVTKLTYEYEDERCVGAEVITQGLTTVFADNIAETELYIKLSLAPLINATELADTFANETDTAPIIVDLTAGYTCNTNYSPEYGDYMANYFFRDDCGLPQYW